MGSDDSFSDREGSSNLGEDKRKGRGRKISKVRML